MNCNLLCAVSEPCSISAEGISVFVTQTMLHTFLKMMIPFL